MTEEPFLPPPDELAPRTGLGAVLSRFPALATPAFRSLLLALTLAELGLFAVQTAVIWVVLEETGSPSLVGLSMALLSGSFLAAVLLVGLLADRTGPQRSMLIGTLGASLIVGIGAVATLFDGLVPLISFGMAVASGALAALIMIPGQLLAARIVGRSQVTSALGLRYVPVGFAWLLGGLLAGITLAVAGVAATFAAVAAVMLLATWIVSGLPRPPGLESSGLTAPIQLRLAFRYMSRSAVIMGLVGLAAIVGMFVMSRMSMYPALVRDVLEAGPGALGSFMAVHGLGAIVGALAADPMGRAIGRGRAAILSLALCGAALAGIGLSDSLVLSLALAGVATAGLVGHLATGSALVQLATPVRMRGRVVAAWDFGRLASLTVGSLVGGLLTDAIGPSLVFLIYGLMTVAAVLVIRIRNPRLWRLRVDRDGHLVEAIETPA